MSILIVECFQKEKRLIEESVEKKAVQPKQQTSKKEKIKIEAEEVDEKRPRVEVSSVLHSSYLKKFENQI